MSALIHELLTTSADRTPQARALKFKKAELSNAELASLASRFAGGLITSGPGRQERVAVYMPKRPRTVTTIFGTTLAGHILRDCDVRVLVTTAQRLNELAVLAQSPALRLLIVLDAEPADPTPGKTVIGWEDFLATASGSTGKPKGVVLTHKTARPACMRHK